MVDGLEFLLEHVFGRAYVLESDGTICEVAFCHLCVDYAVHEFADALLGVFLQRAGRGLHGVGHHQYGLLGRERVGAGIGEGRVINHLVGMLVFIGDIEVFHEALAMVRRDEIAD